MTDYEYYIFPCDDVYDEYEHLDHEDIAVVKNHATYDDNVVVSVTPEQHLLWSLCVDEKYYYSHNNMTEEKCISYVYNASSILDLSYGDVKEFGIIPTRLRPPRSVLEYISIVNAYSVNEFSYIDYQLEIINYINKYIYILEGISAEMKTAISQEIWFGTFVVHPQNPYKKQNTYDAIFDIFGISTGKNMLFSSDSDKDIITAITNYKNSTHKDVFSYLSRRYRINSFHLNVLAYYLQHGTINVNKVSTSRDENSYDIIKDYVLQTPLDEFISQFEEAYSDYFSFNECVLRTISKLYTTRNNSKDYWIRDYLRNFKTDINRTRNKKISHLLNQLSYTSESFIDLHLSRI